MITNIEIKPCPWCKKTPSFCMFLNDLTWTPRLECNNICNVSPKSKYVPIRKKQKYNAEIIKEKIIRMIMMWNENSPINAYEALSFDFEKIADEEAKRDGFR